MQPEPKAPNDMSDEEITAAIEAFNQEVLEKGRQDTRPLEEKMRDILKPVVMDEGVPMSLFREAIRRGLM